MSHTPTDQWAPPSPVTATAGAEDRPEAPPEPAGQAASVLRLLLVIAVVAVVSNLAGVGKTVAVLAAIIVMIVLHEFGHFTMAKLAKIKVTEFFVGFGTRLWSIRKGETEYGVKVLPLGGYVKIIGMNSLEEVDPADEARTYRQQPFWRRLSVAVAGSAMHFLIALVLLFSIFFFVGDQGYLVGPTPGARVEVSALSSLENGPSPAQQAGLHVGDQIVSINGQTFANDVDMTNYIRSRPDQTLDFLVDRHGKLIHLYPKTVDLTKIQVKTAPGSAAPSAATKPTGFVGFAPGYPATKFGFLQSVNHSGGSFVSVTASTFGALGQLFSAHGISSYANMLVNQKAADAKNAVRFESPVGITRLANQAAHNGLEETLLLLVAINIFVGIFNMIPLLPLDGGHVAIAIYEAVRSRKGKRYHADAAKMMPFVYATLAVIGFIAVSALFLDLRDVISVVGLIR
jgi:membrane-associated protease RseP (regulator of RpoE activity)